MIRPALLFALGASALAQNPAPFVTEAPAFPDTPPVLAATLGRAEKVKEVQTQAGVVQSDAERHLSFAPESLEGVRELQRAAEAAQAAADGALSEVSYLHAQIAEAAGEARQFHGFVLSSSGGVEKARRVQAEAAETLPRLEAELAELNRQAADPATFQDVPKKELSRARDALKKRIRAAEKKRDDTRRRGSKAVSEEKNFMERMQGQLGHYQAHAEKLRAIRERLPAAQAQARETQQAATAAQRAAYEALIAQADEAKKDGAKDAAKPTAKPATEAAPAATTPADATATAATSPAPADGATTAATTPAPSPATAAATTPAPSPSSGGSSSKGAASSSTASATDLLDAAATTENAIAETYRDIRATDLAVIRGLTREEARAATDVPKPERPPLDTGTLGGSPSTPAGREKYNTAMEKALTHVDSMIRFGSQLLDAVGGPVSPSSPSPGRMNPALTPSTAPAELSVAPPPSARRSRPPRRMSPARTRKTSAR